MRPLLLHLHSRPVTLVKFNRDGDLLLTCAKDGLACLVHTEDGERIGTYEGHNGAIYGMDITLDNNYVVTCGADGLVIFFEALTGRILHSYEHGGIVKFVEFNGEPGRQDKIVTCNDKFKAGVQQAPNRIMVWEFRDGQAVSLLQIDDSQLPMKANKVKWGPFDETLVSVHDEGTVCIWDSADGQMIREITDEHSGLVTNLQFSTDKMLMLTAGKDMTARLWETQKWQVFKTYTTNRPLNDAGISPLYKKGNVKGSDHLKMHLCVGGGQDAKDVTTTKAGEGQFECLLIHAVYDDEIGSVKGHFGPVNSLAWKVDGSGFVTGGEDGYVRINHFDPDYFTKKVFD